MRDTCFHERVTFHHESRLFVERLGMTLRVQHGILKTAIDGAADQRIQHHCTNALASPCFQDRHASDVSVRQQAARSNCLTGADCRDRMLANGIEFIHLDRHGNTLLVDEHRLPDWHGLGSRERPGEETNMNVDRA